MEVRDTLTGNFVRLVPVRYEFQHRTGDSFDDNWLVIGLQVQCNDATWAFEDPALLVDEAHEVASWLLAAGEGRLSPLTPDDHGHTQPDTDFLEPTIGFGLVAFSLQLLTIRVFLCVESPPPNMQTEWPWNFYVDLTTTPSSLVKAADEWTNHLVNFTVR